MPEYIGTAKAARWLSLSEPTIRRLCRHGQLPGSYQFGRYGKWLISTRALEAIRPCPKDLLTEMTALTEITDL